MHTSHFAPAPGHSEQVLYAVQGRLGRVRLNRPRAVNALTRAMVDSMLEQLTGWAEEGDVGAVFLDGAGDKGLCAGGDVRALREAITEGRPEEALAFWEAEYALNALIADYPKPVVAWMDGVVMGGGVGVSAHASHRLVTERSTVAMPETVIGFFPDVGGLWFLAHAPGELGTHVALTGLPISGADAVEVGLADAMVDADSKEAVLAQVGDALAGSDGHVGEVLPAAAHFGAVGTLPQDPDHPAVTAELIRQRSWIDPCYSGRDPGAILDRLRAHEAPAARAAAEAVAARSPHSVAVTLEALRRAADMDVHQVLAQDARLGRAFAAHPDFAEGVRALLVDKDRSPRWADLDVTAVGRDRVLAAFGD